MSAETKTALAGAAVVAAEGQALTANGTPGSGDGQADAIRALLSKLSDDDVRLLSPYVSRPLAPGENGAPSSKAEQVKSNLITKSMADIAPEPLCWLWPGVIPLGKLTLLVGDPGLGKSLLTLDFAARVSEGDTWPDGTQGKYGLGEILLLSAEDDPADTIRPRLDAAGAAPEMIRLIKAVRDGKRDRSFNLEADTATLEQAITSETLLIIIDPITAYLGGIDSHVTADVRGLLAPLAELAARRGVAIVAVSHLNKSSGPAMYRTTGSLAFVAAARAVWAVGLDPEDETRILMLPVKQNLAKKEGGFAYRIETGHTPSGILAPRVAWEEGRVRGDATQLLSNEEPGERAAWQEAADWLRERLAGSGSVPAKDIQREAAENGITKKPLWEASKRVGVVKGKSSYAGGWTWSLPASTPSKITEASQDFPPRNLGNLGNHGNLGNGRERDFAV
jgi:hypothetical protein